jgi:hypothetical protein
VIAIPRLIGNPYRDGEAKYCQCCEKYMPYYWIFCPCCGCKLRVRMKKKVTVERKYLKECEYKICAPNERIIDVML